MEMITLKDFEEISYRQLQNVAKITNIPANLKRNRLIELLIARFREDESLALRFMKKINNRPMKNTLMKMQRQKTELEKPLESDLVKPQSRLLDRDRSYNRNKEVLTPIFQKNEKRPQIEHSRRILNLDVEEVMNYADSDCESDVTVISLRNQLDLDDTPPPNYERNSHLLPTDDIRNKRSNRDNIQDSSNSSKSMELKENNRRSTNLSNSRQNPIQKRISNQKFCVNDHIQSYGSDNCNSNKITPSNCNKNYDDVNEKVTVQLLDDSQPFVNADTINMNRYNIHIREDIMQNTSNPENNQGSRMADNKARTTDKNDSDEFLKEFLSLELKYDVDLDITSAIENYFDNLDFPTIVEDSSTVLSSDEVPVSSEEEIYTSKVKDTNLKPRNCKNLPKPTNVHPSSILCFICHRIGKFSDFEQHVKTKHSKNIYKMLDGTTTIAVDVGILRKRKDNQTYHFVEHRGQIYLIHFKYVYPDIIRPVILSLPPSGKITNDRRVNIHMQAINYMNDQELLWSGQVESLAQSRSLDKSEIFEISMRSLDLISKNTAVDDIQNYLNGLVIELHIFIESLSDPGRCV